MKKGFTLVELLVVIVILSLIAVVVYPTIAKIINDSKENTYNTQVNLIVKAAKEWGAEHPNKLPSKETDDGLKVCISSLVSEGYINDTVKNPNTSQEMNGYVEITLVGNKYEYVYIDTEEECLDQTT